MVGKFIFWWIAFALFGENFNDLRDDIAGALDHNHIPDADTLAFNLIFVVQRGIGHDHAADGDRL